MKQPTATIELPPLPRDARFDALLARMGDRDRQNIERHMMACQLEQTEDHLHLWRRLACHLEAIAPFSVKTSGQRALQYFISDGKYRLQAFALEDLRKGLIAIYAPDVVREAIESRILCEPVKDESDGDFVMYPLVEQPRLGIRIESLTAQGTSGAPDYYKHMLGWNRRTVRVVFSTSIPAFGVHAIERFCALAAQQITAVPAKPASNQE